MNYKWSLFSFCQIRKITCSSLNQKSHYDSLGISKNATQADVKDAYYKLSKVYHPDRNQGHTENQREQHSQKFRDISEAYEVLGNVRTRKLYDKGFMGIQQSHTTPEDPMERFYQSRKTRTKPPTSSGRQPIYDFDEWSRQHYGQTLKRNREIKDRKDYYKAQEEHRKVIELQEKSLYILLAFIFIWIWIREMADYDFVKPSTSKSKNPKVNSGDERG